MGHECPGGFKMLLQLMPSGEASSEGGDLGMLVCGPSSESASRPSSFPGSPGGLRLAQCLSQKPRILETRLFQML